MNFNDVHDGSNDECKIVNTVGMNDDPTKSHFGLGFKERNTSEAKNEDENHQLQGSTPLQCGQQAWRINCSNEMMIRDDVKEGGIEMIQQRVRCSFGKKSSFFERFCAQSIFLSQYGAK